jgi:alkylated DNA repair dioxygenase AlkB
LLCQSRSTIAESNHDSLALVGFYKVDQSSSQITKHKHKHKQQLPLSVSILQSRHHQNGRPLRNEVGQDLYLHERAVFTQIS